jgi:hypothetical protein
MVKNEICTVENKINWKYPKKYLQFVGKCGNVNLAVWKTMHCE